MSRKRHLSLSSKWKLGKEYSDYKQNKKNKRGGGLGYLEKNTKVKRNKRRSKHPCKRLKGEHDFVFQEEHKYTFMQDVYNFYKCSACGKEHMQPKYSYECEECGADSWLWFFLGTSDSNRKKCKKCGSYKFKKILNKRLDKH